MSLRYDLLCAVAAIALGSGTGLVLGAVISPVDTLTPEQIAGQSSVKLSKEGAHGSGVIVGKNLILTNQHVAENFGKEGFKVTLPNGATGIGHVLATGVGIDLALVEADTGSLPVAKIDCSMPAIGQGIYAFGNPLLLDRVVTWGHVAAAPIEARDDDTAKVKGLVPMDLTINPGNSGGGVWTTRRGKPELVGIAKAVLTASLGHPFGDGSLSGLSLMIPAPTLCHFLGRQ
jgi:serine protease Do